MRFSATCFALFCSVALTGCGATLPQIDLIHPVDVEKAPNVDFDNFVQNIAAHVVCEVRYSVDSLYQDSPKSPRHILDSWAAKIELDLNAMDTGDLNPGLSTFTKSMSFALGLNGKLETQGVNNVSMTYFLPFNEIKSKGPHNPSTTWKYSCDQPSELIKEPIEGTLGIESILEAGLLINDTRGSVGYNLKSGPFDTISKTVSFQITTSGSINPTWKFTNLSLITPGPLAQATRVSSNKLIITMGPNALGTDTELRKKGGVRGATIPITGVSPAGSSALDESFFLERLKSALTRQPTD